jgi:hypothetical protein
MSNEANWQAQSNEQQEWDADHDLHTAWCNVAMDLANNYAEAYCNHQCDDTQDCLHELGRTRRELKQHLWGQPASMGPTSDDTALLRQILAAIESGEPFDYFDNVLAPTIRERLA